MKLKRHKSFIKDWRKVSLTDGQYEKFIIYVGSLLKGEALPPEALDHPLKGEYDDFREFHLGGDMLIIYQVDDEQLVLFLMGTHSKLFLIFSC